MAIEESIKCPHCGRSVVPRLWLTGGDFLTYIRTQHLCPFCGVVMYETGGTYKRGPLIATAVALGLVLIVLLVVALRYLQQ